MGHERVGLLPKTQRWRSIVQQIAGLHTGDADVPSIAGEVIRNVRARLRSIQSDDGVRAAFEFLVALSVHSRSPNPHTALSNLGIELPRDPTPLSLAKALHRWMEPRKESFEYGEVAERAAVDTIAFWVEKNKTQQIGLFEFADSSLDVWKKAGDGAGFCELSRSFFAKFTERYLNYFLEREASVVLPSIVERERFGREIGEHVQDVSRHAFETAKITQSFAAGWFNKHAIGSMPSEESIEAFLSVAFGKLRDELLREGGEK